MQLKAICTNFKPTESKGKTYWDVSFVDANPNPMERFTGEISLFYRTDFAALKEAGVKPGVEVMLKIRSIDQIRNGNPTVVAVVETLGTKKA